jgi:8-hydroxy-5-deazaflavin:NADPH oxidoreductase
MDSFAIIGAGKVGSILGSIVQNAGFKISYYVRDPEKYSDLSPVHPIQALDERFIILAMPGSNTNNVLKQLGDLTGKVVFDATNRVDYLENGLQNILKDYSKTHFVKIFNTLGFNIMSDPRFGKEVADLFIAGDDPESLEISVKLAENAGLNPVIFPLSSSTNLEAMAWLWITLSRSKGRDIAFKILQR